MSTNQGPWDRSSRCARSACRSGPLRQTFASLVEEMSRVQPRRTAKLISTIPPMFPTRRPLIARVRPTERASFQPEAQDPRQRPWLYRGRRQTPPAASEETPGGVPESTAPERTARTAAPGCIALIGSPDCKGKCRRPGLPSAATRVRRPVLPEAVWRTAKRPVSSDTIQETFRHRDRQTAGSKSTAARPQGPRNPRSSVSAQRIPARPAHATAAGGAARIKRDIRPMLTIIRFPGSARKFVPREVSRLYFAGRAVPSLNITAETFKCRSTDPSAFETASMDPPCRVMGCV